MTAAAIAAPAEPSAISRLLASRAFAIFVIVLAVLILWYAAAIWKNGWVQANMDHLNGVSHSLGELAVAALMQAKPSVPAPHQVLIQTFQSVFLANPTTSASLLFHGWVTLSSALVGFGAGTVLGIVLAIGIVNVRSLEKGLMPWIISSQTVPVLALAPMVIVVLAAIGVKGLIPKAMISTYLSFFPVTVGMVKGLRSPSSIHLDLMRTYNASLQQTLWKLRVPASIPFLFAAMKVAIAASVVGAIVAELPTGAVAGLGAQLLLGTYYSQSIQLWSALVVGSVMAALLVAIVGVVERVVVGRMGARPG
ncbi:MAG: ABC transporter permease subunit [Bauldia sp.]